MCLFLKFYFKSNKGKEIGDETDSLWLSKGKLKEMQKTRKNNKIFNHIPEPENLVLNKLIH